MKTTTFKTVTLIAIMALIATTTTGCATNTAKDPASVELKFIPKNNDVAQFNADVAQCRISISKRFNDMLAGAPDSAMMADCLTVEKGHSIGKL